MIRLFFIISGIVPLLGLLVSPPSTTSVIYTLFVFAVSTRVGDIWKSFGSRLPRLWTLLLSSFLIMVVAETFAWFDSYVRRFAEEGVLLSTSYASDLALGFGYYGGFAFALFLASTFFKFRVSEIFIVSGLVGILLEQDGGVITTVLSSLITDPISAIFLAIFTFAVYGSIGGLIYMPVEQREAGRRSSVFKYIVLAFLIAFCTKIGTGISMLVLGV